MVAEIVRGDVFRVIVGWIAEHVRGRFDGETGLFEFVAHDTRLDAMERRVVLTGNPDVVARHEQTARPSAPVSVHPWMLQILGKQGLYMEDSYQWRVGADNR